jgi:hypothetical protein
LLSEMLVPPPPGTDRRPGWCSIIVFTEPLASKGCAVANHTSTRCCDAPSESEKGQKEPTQHVRYSGSFPRKQPSRPARFVVNAPRAYRIGRACRTGPASLGIPVEGEKVKPCYRGALTRFVSAMR